MTIAFARLTLFVPESRSLKDKRMVLRRVKDRVRQKFNVAVAEVGAQDLWQRAQLGVAALAGDRAFATQALDEVVRFIRAEAEVTNVEREIQTFSDELGSKDLALAAKNES